MKELPNYFGICANHIGFLMFFYAMLQDRGDEELADRIIYAISTVNDCREFLNDFLRNNETTYDKEHEVTIIDAFKQNERQENLNDNQ